MKRPTNILSVAAAAMCGVLATPALVADIPCYHLVPIGQGFTNECVYQTLIDIPVDLVQQTPTGPGDHAGSNMLEVVCEIKVGLIDDEGICQDRGVTASCEMANGELGQNDPCESPH